MTRPLQITLDRVGALAAMCLLVAQCFGVIRMLWADDRFFSWAPHDMRTDVRVAATHGGRTLNAAEISDRYGLPETDWHAWANVLAVVEAAENRRRPVDRWHVELRYRVNFGPEQLWVYPDSVRHR